MHLTDYVIIFYTFQILLIQKLPFSSTLAFPLVWNIWRRTLKKSRTSYSDISTNSSQAFHVLRPRGASAGGTRVHKPFPGQPGALVPRDRPLLVLAGDAFVHSNFSGCVESSLVAVEKLREHMRTFWELWSRVRLNRALVTVRCCGGAVTWGIQDGGSSGQKLKWTRYRSCQKI